MRTVLLLVVLVATGIPSAYAQTETTVVARIGIRHSGTTYHLGQVIQVRNDWILPDIGWQDFAKDDFGEVFIGVGRRTIKTRSFAMTNELYFMANMGKCG